MKTAMDGTTRLGLKDQNMYFLNGDCHVLGENRVLRLVIVETTSFRSLLKMLVTTLVRDAGNVPWGRGCQSASKLESGAPDPSHFVCSVIFRKY